MRLAHAQPGHLQALVAGPLQRAAAAAAEVDRDARFPHEAVAALKEARLLSALVPRELGGMGLSLSDGAMLCTLLGQQCAAAGMVLAMHSIQVACLVRHGQGSPELRAYLQELSEQQRLIASVTSEAGIGGDMRSSACAVEVLGAALCVRKDATTISYGEHADDYLLTARRNKDAAPNDQVLVLLRRERTTLERKGSWDPLGMRGTCSPGFLLTAEGSAGSILPVPFAQIAAETMVPVSHILWSHLWLGIATEAVSRARALVRDQARKNPGTAPSGAARLAELWSGLQVMRSTVHQAASDYDACLLSPTGAAQLTSMGFALKMNNLKVAASTQVVQLVHQALQICGLAGYKNDSKFSLGRQLRDAHSASIMISNDRILAANAALLLVHKED